jgi:hypothetical protein
MYNKEDPRDETGRVSPRQSISFGHSLDENTVRAVLESTGVRPNNFTGFGRHNCEVICDTPNLEQYLMTISADDVWFGVPELLQPQGELRHEIAIDLFYLSNIRSSLQSN